MTGAGNILPVVPAFGSVPGINDLNSLSYAVSFLVNHDVRPAFTAFMSSATMATTASAFKTIAFDHVAFDSDGVFGSNGSGLPTATIVTQGFYSFEACIPLQVNTNADQAIGQFLFTAGASNPHYTVGSTQGFGQRGARMSNSTQAAADNAICLSSWFSTCLYPGDAITVSIYTSTNAHTVDKNSNTSYIQGRLVPRFSGRLMALGS